MAGAALDGELGPLTPELFIERSTWTYAKTMPTIPHEYTVRDATALSPESFLWFVQYIRENGYEAKFGRRSYTYLNFDGWKYWSMGFSPTATTVINREKLPEVMTEAAREDHRGGGVTKTASAREATKRPTSSTAIPLRADTLPVVITALPTRTSQLARVGARWRWAGGVARGESAGSTRSRPRFE